MIKEDKWYDANYDESIVEARLIAEETCFRLNNLSVREKEKRGEILENLLGKLGKEVTILSPFMVDYGNNCFIGDYSFINHNAYLMDGATITIGSHCFIGPNCGLYTAVHPIRYQDRNKGLEKALPIVIGDNCWIGADVTFLPGVTIGQGSVIGAKSLVNKDIPANVVAAGNPCKVIRAISEKDKI